VQIGRTRGAAHSTAKSFDAREIHIWRFGDGLVVSFEVLVDTPEMVAALS
jgi:ketosteroid isomerase-like protein